MREREMSVLLRSLRGAPLFVLVWMVFVHPRSCGERALAEALPYGARTCRQALRELAGLELVFRHSFHSGWSLTAKACQLPLFPQEKLSTTRYNLPGPPSSSSSSKVPFTSKSDTTTTPNPVKFTGLQAQASQELLRQGCSPQVARGAVRAASEWWDDEKIVAQVRAWLRFAQTQPGIKAPAFLAASRIREGVEAPEWCDKNDTERYIQGEYADIIQR